MVIAFLRVIVAQLSQYFNTSGNMSEEQIKQTATDVMEFYYHLTIDDFKLCFQRGRALKYGEIYRIDGSVIMGWLAKYSKERANIAGQINDQKHSETKQRR